MSRAAILNNVLEQVKAAKLGGQNYSVVFDLDSTLFCVSPRIRAILDKLADDPELNRSFPAFAPTIKGLDVTPVDWGIRTVLTRSKIMGTLDFFEMLRAKWANDFFSGAYLNQDRPYPGAVEYVKKLAQAGAEIRYLTGRDWPRMGLGTVASLDQWGLPLQNPQHLHMKPESGRHDAEYKLEVLRHLQSQSPNLCFFENEPVIINLVHRQMPSLPIIFVNSVHSGRETAPGHLPNMQPDYQLIED